MDILTKAERSKRMSLIRSKWTEQEVLVHNYLKARKVRHTMHPVMEGSPDLILKDRKVAVFLHGCFWHGCPAHYKAPVQNATFWAKKVAANRLRDKKNKKTLKKAGWKVVVLWEHELPARKPYFLLRRLRLARSSNPSPARQGPRRSPSG